MRLNQSNTNSKLPNKNSLAKSNLKSKPRNRGKNKKLKSINQLIPSLGTLTTNTKISYLKSPCGTIKCVEKIIEPNKQTQNVQTTPSFRPNKSFSSEVKQKIFAKSKKQKYVKQELKKNQLPSSCQTHSVVKMTHDTNINNGNTILQHFPDNRKNDKSGLSLLESLMVTDFKKEETASKGTKHKKALKGKQFSELIPRDIGLDKHTSGNTRTQSVISNSDKVSNRNDDPLNGPVCSIFLSSNNSNSVTNFYELECSKYLVLMNPESNLSIIGSVEVQVLKGSLEILGYNLNKEGQKLLIYSLLGSSHLPIKAKEENNPTCEQKSGTNIYKKLVALGLSDSLSQAVSIKSQNAILFTVSRHKTDKSSTVWPQFFDHHSSFNVFPNAHLFHSNSRPCHVVERKINCLFETNIYELGLKEFSEIPEWSEIECDIMARDYPKAILCGGKSVGKSSLLRYLVNKCLFKWKRILVLDFDLGQCEFTLPGCISITMVEEPLLGPNYSHLKEPKRCVYLGEVDVTKCPEHYIEGCKSLIDYAKSTHSDLPWLINTMGFTRGFGVSLACGLINYISPTHVVQIQSKDRKINFPSMLEPKYVNCLKHSAFDVGETVTDYKLYAIPAGSEQSGFISKSRNMSPAESRNLVILSYLSRMLDSNRSSLSQVTPYMIGLEQIDLQTTNQFNLTKAQVAATMNGNMVALCHKMPSTGFLNCRGFGIVRAVDWQNDTLYLITPLPPAELSRVNCLVKGNVGLPDSLIYNQGDLVTGHVPYVSLTSGGSTARFAKRDFRSLPVSQNRQRR